MTGESGAGRSQCQGVVTLLLTTTGPPRITMAAETLYTAINDYLKVQYGSALAEVGFARQAIRLEYSRWTDARLVASEARLACVKMMLHNLAEAYDNVPIPDDWRSLVTADKRNRRKKTADKSKIRGILKRTRGES